MPFFAQDLTAVNNIGHGRQSVGTIWLDTITVLLKPETANENELLFDLLSGILGSCLDTHDLSVELD